jgi:hypothetical protein
MRFRVTLKSPDSLTDAVNDAVNESVADVEGLDEEEIRDLKRERREDLYVAASKWFQYREYLTVEIDTEAGTAVVCPSTRSGSRSIA